MLRSPVLLVPFDHSPDTEPTVRAALALARKHGGEVHLLEVVSGRGPSLLDAGTSTGRREAPSLRDGSRLTRSIAAGDRKPATVRTAAYRGKAAQVIPAYAQQVKADLLVLGQHYGTPQWRRNSRLVSSLSRAAPCSVLVLPTGLSPQAAARAFTHVVSAVDFTLASAVALRTVLDLIRRSGARLTLVHALTEARQPTAYSGGEAATLTRNLQRRAAAVADRLRRKMPADVRVRVDARVTTGDPHRAILGVASEVAADLLVMGVARRSRFDEVLFGSTLRQVLRRTTIPVLVLPVPAGADKTASHPHGLVPVVMSGRGTKLSG